MFTLSHAHIDNTSVICDKPAACPGETVTCTCTTAHSNTIAWSSDEQDDMQLEFASVEPVTTRRNVTNSSTFAVLTDSSDVNGVVVLMSDLTFIASENPANLLTCLNSDLQSSRSIIVPVYSKYFVMVIIVIDVLASSACPYFLATVCHIMYNTYNVPHTLLSCAPCYEHTQ